MARRSRRSILAIWQRSVDAVARRAMKAGTDALVKSLRAPPLPKPWPDLSTSVKKKSTTRRRPSSSSVAARKTVSGRSTKAASERSRRLQALIPVAPAKVSGTRAGSREWIDSIAIGPAGARRTFLYRPPGVRTREPLPLLVMLHGCRQDAAAFAASTRMNALAARQRFFVLYPEQDRLSNPQGCWNWHEMRSGRALAEVATLEAAIEQACRTQPIDRDRIAIAGLSAGAGMAALMATRRPERYRAICMHSGVAPGFAHSAATALSAMRGRRRAASPSLAPARDATPWPPLLVIQGGADSVVAAANGREAALLWASRAGAVARPARRVQRGKRRATAVVDFKAGARLVARWCEVERLGHAWSGGAAGRAYSDPAGPDASRLIWAFASRQFARAQLAAKQ